jgi:hypothetical protein
MQKLKIIMGCCAVLTILLIAKLSIAEADSQNLDIQPVSYPQQVISTDNVTYTTVEETVVETHSH